MELLLAALGVVVAFAMILASSKRSRRVPPEAGAADRTGAPETTGDVREGGGDEAGGRG